MSDSPTVRKIIRIGAGAQPRIAQACDRCRIKKIRCDGIEGRCSQCALVGLECKTSHTLSRRAFPKGYTESLEKHVRQLEAQITDLKTDIDVMSRMLLRSSQPVQLPSPTKSPEISEMSFGALPAAGKEEDCDQSTPASLPPSEEGQDGTEFMGSLCVKIFVETLRYAVEESGRTNVDIDSTVERFGLLLQGMHSDSRAGLVKEDQKVIRSTIGILDRLNQRSPSATVKKEPGQSQKPRISPPPATDKQSSPEQHERRPLVPAHRKPGNQQNNSEHAQPISSDWSAYFLNNSPHGKLQSENKPRQKGLNLDYMSFDSDTETAFATSMESSDSRTSLPSPEEYLSELAFDSTDTRMEDDGLGLLNMQPVHPGFTMEGISQNEWMSC